MQFSFAASNIQQQLHPSLFASKDKCVSHIGFKLSVCTFSGAVLWDALGLLSLQQYHILRSLLITEIISVRQIHLWKGRAPRALSLLDRILRAATL